MGRLIIHNVKFLPLESLIPYPRNARTHTAQQIAQIAASITEFGWTNPILVDGENGVIAGHGRILAAKSLGMKDVPCLELTGLSDAQRRAYILADNKLALNAGWDNDLLTLELNDLAEMKYELPILGFSDKELSDFLGTSSPERELDVIDEKKYLLMIEYDNESALERAYNDANSKGLHCKIIE